VPNDGYVITAVQSVAITEVRMLSKRYTHWERMFGAFSTISSPASDRHIRHAPGIRSNAFAAHRRRFADPQPLDGLPWSARRRCGTRRNRIDGGKNTGNRA